MDSDRDEPPAEARPTPGDLLALDVDLRLYAVLLDAWAETNPDERTAAAFLRLAYGRGYCDALTERYRGQLCRDHGLPIPTREGVG